MNESFRIGSAILLRTLYKNVILVNLISFILFPNFPSQEIGERQRILSHNRRQLLLWLPDFGTFVNYFSVSCCRLLRGESSNRSKAVSEHYKFISYIGLDTL